MDTLKISKSDQFQYENKTWGRSLEFFRQENNVLKNRLSIVVDHKTGKEFLALAEHFQNMFIIKDEFMDELNHDINAQVRMLLESVISTMPPVNEKLIKRQDKLRNEMEFLEKDFVRLKNEFNKYLATVL